VFRDPPSSFDVLDLTAGTTLAAGVAYVPGTAIAFNGWSTRLDGEPGAGDRFRVEPNAGGYLSPELPFSAYRFLLGAPERPECRVGGTFTIDSAYSELPELVLPNPL